MPSLTYYLTLGVIKLKGLKKNFSSNPIDYQRIRKDDVLTPKGNFWKQQDVQQFTILKSQITGIKQKKTSNKLLIFVHGGAFISGPSQIHWDAMKTIFEQTDYNIWLCDYPKAPENKIDVLNQNIDEVYQAALEKYAADSIVLLGDSVGGTLITTLVQRLVIAQKPIPQKMVLLSPVMDASMSNPRIEAIDKIDPVLGKSGILSAKKMCAGNYALDDPIISPLYGSFEGFPNTMLLLGERDIMYPDEQLAINKMRTAGVNSTVVEGTAMPHIWPILPVMKEAKVALQQIIDYLK